MNAVLITYDLKKPGRNYNAVYELLAQLGARQLTESTYLVRSGYSLKAIADAMAQRVDPNDYYFVVEAGQVVGRGEASVIRWIDSGMRAA